MHWGSSSSSQVLFNGFLLVYINSEHQRRLWRTSVLNTQAFCSTQSPRQSIMYWHVTDILPVVTRPPLKTHSSTGLGRGGCASIVSACASTFLRVYRKSEMTAYLFLVQDTKFCCCVVAALYLGQAPGSSTMEYTGIAPAVLSDPPPSSSYISGRGLQESWVVVREDYQQKEKKKMLS